MRIEPHLGNFQLKLGHRQAFWENTLPMPIRVYHSILAFMAPMRRLSQNAGRHQFNTCRMVEIHKRNLICVFHTLETSNELVMSLLCRPELNADTSVTIGIVSPHERVVSNGRHGEHADALECLLEVVLTFLLKLSESARCHGMEHLVDNLVRS